MQAHHQSIRGYKRTVKISQGKGLHVFIRTAQKPSDWYWLMPQGSAHINANPGRVYMRWGNRAVRTSHWAYSMLYPLRSWDERPQHEVAKSYWIQWADVWMGKTAPFSNTSALHHCPTLVVSKALPIEENSGAHLCEQWIRESLWISSNHAAVWKSAGNLRQQIPLCFASILYWQYRLTLQGCYKDYWAKSMISLNAWIGASKC